MIVIFAVILLTSLPRNVSHLRLISLAHVLSRTSDSTSARTRDLEVLLVYGKPSYSFQVHSSRDLIEE
jgi:hypothetical protein